MPRRADSRDSHGSESAIATGHTSSLEDFVAEAFAAVALDWRKHVVRDPTLVRPTEIAVGRADPSKAADRLGWQATYRMPNVVRMMVAARLEREAGERPSPA
ncbi:MAG: GDP-mannose 4,6-dehydratase [Planctomycetia bacterium]